MKARFLDWWQGRSRREQRLLLALAVVAAVVLGCLLVLRPLDQALADAKDRHNEAAILLSETRARADAVAALQSKRLPALSAPLATVVSQAATEAGFTIGRLDGGADGGATLVLAAARPQALFAWLAEMERRPPIRVSQLTASTNTDQTLSVQVTFLARSD